MIFLLTNSEQYQYIFKLNFITNLWKLAIRKLSIPSDILNDFKHPPCKTDF